MISLNIDTDSVSVFISDNEIEFFVHITKPNDTPKKLLFRVHKFLYSSDKFNNITMKINLKNPCAICNHISSSFKCVFYVLEETAAQPVTEKLIVKPKRQRHQTLAQKLENAVPGHEYETSLKHFQSNLARSSAHSDDVEKDVRAILSRLSLKIHSVDSCSGILFKGIDRQYLR